MSPGPLRFLCTFLLPVVAGLSGTIPAPPSTSCATRQEEDGLAGVLKDLCRFVQAGGVAHENVVVEAEADAGNRHSQARTGMSVVKVVS